MALGAAVVVAAPSELSAATPARPSTTVVVPTPALGPVTVHAISPLAPTEGGGGSVTQVVQVAVIGGDLTLATPTATIELRRGPSSTWTGALPPVRVVDARGTHAGWTVRWTVAQITVTAGAARRDLGRSATVVVRPSLPVVVHGLPDGLSAGGADGVLLRAEPGGGGGTYEAGGQVDVLVPPGLDVTDVVVQLGFAVG